MSVKAANYIQMQTGVLLIVGGTLAVTTLPNLLAFSERAGLYQEGQVRGQALNSITQNPVRELWAQDYVFDPNFPMPPTVSNWNEVMQAVPERVACVKDSNGYTVGRVEINAMGEAVFEFSPGDCLDVGNSSNTTYPTPNNDPTKG